MTPRKIIEKKSFYGKLDFFSLFNFITHIVSVFIFYFTLFADDEKELFLNFFFIIIDARKRAKYTHVLKQKSQKSKSSPLVVTMAFSIRIFETSNIFFILVGSNKQTRNFPYKKLDGKE